MFNFYNTVSDPVFLILRKRVQNNLDDDTMIKIINRDKNARKDIYCANKIFDLLNETIKK